MNDQAPTWDIPLTHKAMADINKSYQCLETADSKNSTEVLTMAAQKQALRTKPSGWNSVTSSSRQKASSVQPVRHAVVKVRNYLKNHMNKLHRVCKSLECLFQR